MKKAETANEVLDQDFINSGVRGEVMTVDGAVNKSYILGAFMVAGAFLGYSLPTPLLTYGSMFGGLIIAIIMGTKPHLSPTLGPIVSVLYGVLAGGVSFTYGSMYGGIILQAVTLTMAIFFVMLTIHKTGLIPVTDKFRRGVVMATGSIMLVYLLSWILGMFGIQIPYLHQGGMIGIGISLAIIGVASLNLLLDFDNFEKGAQNGAPKYMEWFYGTGLIVTLVWLYIEIIRLLAIFAGND